MDRSCPSTWIKVSSNKSKKVVRYHPPEVTEAAAALECANEKHTIAADAAWKEFLASFREHYTTFKSATSAVATLDSLHALAILSRNEGVNLFALGLKYLISKSSLSVERYAINST